MMDCVDDHEDFKNRKWNENRKRKRSCIESDDTDNENSGSDDLIRKKKRDGRKRKRLSSPSLVNESQKKLGAETDKTAATCMGSAPIYSTMLLDLSNPQLITGDGRVSNESQSAAINPNPEYFADNESFSNISSPSVISSPTASDRSDSSGDSGLCESTRGNLNDWFEFRIALEEASEADGEYENNPFENKPFDSPYFDDA